MTRLLEQIERRLDKKDSSRPFRDKIDELVEELPEGPLGKGGEGEFVGAAGYVLASSGQLAFSVIPGARSPGYHVISHGSEAFENYVRHTIRIEAVSQQVARTAAEYGVAAPSNIDYFTAETEIVSIEKVKERPTYTTFEIVVDVADRGQEEDG